MSPFVPKFSEYSEELESLQKGYLYAKRKKEELKGDRPVPEQSTLKEYSEGGCKMKIYNDEGKGNILFDTFNKATPYTPGSVPAYKEPTGNRMEFNGKGLVPKASIISRPEVPGIRGTQKQIKDNYQRKDEGQMRYSSQKANGQTLGQVRSRSPLGFEVADDNHVGKGINTELLFQDHQIVITQDKWIQKAHLKEGAFTKKAEASGKSVQGFASHVLANKEDYSAKTEKQAALAKTFSKMKK